jgi:tRNA nucleotidyltransferase (CCA-adding enzyme)
MVEVLQACGALAVLLPELGGPDLVEDAPVDTAAGDTRGAASGAGVHPIAWAEWLAALDRCAERQAGLPVCFAVLVARAVPADGAEDRAGDAAALAIAERLRAPVECRDLAALFARERKAAARTGRHGADLLAAIAAMEPPALLELLDRCDGWRKPARVDGLLHAAAALQDADPQAHSGAARLRRVLEAARAIDQGAIAKRSPGEPEAIRNAIRNERLKVIAAVA